MKKILICLLSILLLTGCKENERIIKDQNFTSNDTLSKNITMKSAIANEQLILFITNNNKELIDIKISVDFYDKDETIVDNTEDIFSAISHKKEIAIPFEIYKEYEYYKVNLEASPSTYTSHENSLIITEKEDDKNEKMVFKVSNKGDKEIRYIDLTIVYFKNNEVIGVANHMSGQLKPDEDMTFNLEYPYTSDFKVLDYDNYKLYINEACSYNLDEE